MIFIFVLSKSKFTAEQKATIAQEYIIIYHLILFYGDGFHAIVTIENLRIISLKRRSIWQKQEEK